MREHDARVAQRLQPGEARRLMALLAQVTHYAGDAPGALPISGAANADR